MSAPLSEIKSLSDYLTAFGPILASKAIKSLSPLHVPGKDELPDFSHVPENRYPFDAQQHLVAGSIKMLDTHGGGFICGEMGVGKSVCAVLTVDSHAKRSRRQGGCNGHYRAIVICPDHLVKTKWPDKEIQPTLPGATVLTFDKWWEFLLLGVLSHEQTKVIKGQEKTKPPEVCSVSTGPGTFEDRPCLNPFREWQSGMVLQCRKQWKKPVGATWIVVGRDQIKRQSGSSSLGQPRKCFDGKTRKGHPCVPRIAEHKDVLNEDGSKVWNPTKNGYGAWEQKAVVDKVLICPRCGATPTKKGVPISPAALGGTKANKRVHCEAVIFDEIPPDDGKCAGLDQLVARETLDSKSNAAPYEMRKVKLDADHPVKIVTHGGKKWRARLCGEPLYQYDGNPYWWPPALLLQRKLRKIAQYLVIDEAHEQKKDDSQQSLAAGKILGVTSYCLALTGTMIGGYAWHVFALLMRMAPEEITARGFKWGDGTKDFTERYGCIDRIEYSETSVDDGNSRSRGIRSRLGASRTERRCRPGIMPALFSQVVMPLAMFLKLEQFVDDLPGFDDNRFHALDLPPDIHAAYTATQATLAAANQKLISSGCMKLMGRMLWTLLQYPDHPWGWEPMFRGNEPKDDTHAVGWWTVPKVWTRNNFNGVTTPPNFDKGIVLPKERKLIELCTAYKEAGDQSWVFCEMTDKMNVMPRLARLLEAEGLRTHVLKSGDVDRRDRLEWIDQNGPLYDVMISHPQLVATGVDLFSTGQGGHNFNHLIFYQTGYNLFRLVQASRRSWRISQWKDCTVDYMFYSGTAQAAAVALMGRKARAMVKLQEGEVGDEGLAIMDSQGDGDGALVKALSQHIDPTEIQRNWGRVKGGAGKASRRPAGASAEGASGNTLPGAGNGTASLPGAALVPGPLPVPSHLYQSELIPAPGEPSPLDSLPAAEQLAAEVTLKVEQEIEEAVAALKLFAGDERKECIYCAGSGIRDGDPQEECSHCRGTGKLDEEDGPLPGTPDYKVPEEPEALSRESLAAMFNALRAGGSDEEDEEWDW